MESVSWYEALEFCTKLSAMTGRKFTLPSEAQWEYACRAGTTTRYSFGAFSSELSNYAWWNGNQVAYSCSSELCTMPSPVGTKLPNNWGLYDMLGNVSEWCLDSKVQEYIGAPTDGSAWVCSDEGPANHDNDECVYRIVRGGSFACSLEQVKSAIRVEANPTSKFGTFGFRVVETTN